MGPDTDQEKPVIVGMSHLYSVQRSINILRRKKFSAEPQGLSRATGLKSLVRGISRA